MIRPIVFASIIFGAFPIAAQTVDAPQEYKACLDVAKKNPEAGWEEALAWQGLGGGEAARHCAAVALIGLGKYGEAATRLETLANESVREDFVRAEMLAQAAQAWSAAENYTRADSDLRGALVLSPGNLEIMMDQAVLMAQVHHYGEAADILSHVLRAQPNRVEALTLRAGAFRYLGNMTGAQDDVERSLKLDPDFPDALLERGILFRLNGNAKAARTDWMRVLELASDLPVGDLARRNIELLDVKRK